MIDVLTWEGIRNLATCEVLNLGPDMAIVPSDPLRPVIKWHHQRRLAADLPRAIPQVGDCVYARAAWRAPWRAQIVTEIQQPVVLLSTFYDPTIKPDAVAEMFPPGSPIRHWFGVQAMATHPQLTAMPVGVEGSIVPHLEAGERRATRDILLYCNFKLDHAYQHRDMLRIPLWKHFAPLPWVTADPWVKSGVTPYIAQLGRSKFVLSPPGYGWDCYRTYEAILMGAIPIVRRKRPMTDVCEVLPVLLVDDWTEVTEERLNREWETWQPKPLDTLTLTYWRRQIQREAQACIRH